MEQVLRDHRARGLALLAVNIEEDRETVARWARAKTVTSTLLLDPTGSVNRAYRVTGTPTVFVVGRDGTLVGKAFSTKEWMGPVGRALLQALLTG